jgi:excisionase family DNA binding protein
MKPHKPLFLTLKQIAERWQVSEKTVRRLISRNVIKVHRIGGQIRIIEEDLVAYEKVQRN